MGRVVLAKRPRGTHRKRLSRRIGQRYQTRVQPGRTGLEILIESARGGVVERKVSEHGEGGEEREESKGLHHCVAMRGGRTKREREKPEPNPKRRLFLSESRLEGTVSAAPTVRLQSKALEERIKSPERGSTNSGVLGCLVSVARGNGST